MSAGRTISRQELVSDGRLQASLVGEPVEYQYQYQRAAYPTYAASAQAQPVQQQQRLRPYFNEGVPQSYEILVPSERRLSQERIASSNPVWEGFQPVQSLAQGVGSIVAGTGRVVQGVHAEPGFFSEDYDVFDATHDYVVKPAADYLVMPVVNIAARGTRATASTVTDTIAVSGSLTGAVVGAVSMPAGYHVGKVACYAAKKVGDVAGYAVNAVSEGVSYLTEPSMPEPQQEVLRTVAPQQYAYYEPQYAQYAPRVVPVMQEQPRYVMEQVPSSQVLMMSEPAPVYQQVDVPVMAMPATPVFQSRSQQVGTIPSTTQTLSMTSLPAGAGAGAIATFGPIPTF